MVELRKRLGEVLIDMGLLSEEELHTAMEEQKTTGESLGKILVRMGAVSGEGLSSALAQQFGMEYVKLSEMEIKDEVLKQIPPAIAKRQKIVPVAMDDGTLTVAMSDPLELLTLDNLQAMLECEIKGVVAPEAELDEAIKKYYGAEESTIDTIVDEMSQTALEFGAEAQAGESGEDEEVEDSAIVKLVTLIILEAFRSRASDIHIEPLEKKFRVRYRVDGVLQEVPGPPRRLKGPVTQRIKLMSGMDIAEKRVPQDGRIKIKLMGKDLDLRVSALPGLFGESIVMRILDKSSLLLGLDELGFMGEDRKKFESAITSAHGIFLVTGPTGSGKTTTLYACLNILNTPDKKLITVEEPVEYMLSGINQSQVRSDIGLTFARVLRSMLRQAPDIILVGEIRDFETAEIAVRSALTGHLVFSTLHTNDAPTAVTRLIDLGVKPFLVASSVQAVMGQRLVRNICPECKEEYEARADELIAAGMDPAGKGKVGFYKGKGCDACNFTGYRGRSGIFELMLVSNKLQEMIMQEVVTASIREQARKEGMKTLREDGLRKALAGVTTLAEVLRVTQQDVE